MIRKLAVFFAVCAAAIIAAAPWVPSLVRALTPSPETSEHWFPYTPPTIMEKLGFFVSAFAPMFLIALCVGMIVVSVILVLTARRRKAAFAGYIAACMALFALGGGPALALSGIQQLLLFDQDEDGIHLDFTKSIENGGCCAIKAPGQPAQRGKFTDLFTFTRNSVGTFLGSNGLIQYALYNGIRKSNAFDDVVWTKTNVTVTPGTVETLDPFGGSAATELLETAVTATHELQVANVAGYIQGHVYTMAIWAKANGRDWIRVAFPGTAYPSGAWCFFNLTTAAVGTCTNAAGAMQGAGNGWYRVAITATAEANQASGNNFPFAISANGSTINQAGDDTLGLYIFAAMQFEGAGLPPYIANTTNNPAYDQPRIEYDASGNVLGYLGEGGGNNDILWSEDFTNAAWVNTNTTDASNTAVAPDGNTTADTITATADNGTIVQNMQADTSNTLRTATVYLQRLTGTGAVTLEVGKRTTTCTLSVLVWTRCATSGTGTGGTYAVVSNVVTATVVAHGLNTGDSARLDYSSGTAADFSCAAVTVLSVDIFTCPQTTGDTTGSVVMIPAVMRIRFATNGDAVYAWGGMSDPRQFATSYIPTTTAVVFRAADVAVRTFGPEFNVLEGTIIATLDLQAAAAGFVRQPFTRSTGGGGVSGVRVQDSQEWTITDGTTTLNAGVAPTANLVYKGGASWGAAGMAVVVDGGTIATSAFAGTLGNTGDLVTIGGTSTGGFYGHVLRVHIYPTQKPNSFLIRQTLPGRMSFVLPAPANDNEILKLAAN